MGLQHQREAPDRWALDPAQGTACSAQPELHRVPGESRSHGRVVKVPAGGLSDDVHPIALLFTEWDPELDWAKTWSRDDWPALEPSPRLRLTQAPGVLCFLVF